MKSLKEYKVLNPAEAPEGYYAILKSDIAKMRTDNICRACDWRTTCQKDDTNFTQHNHRCMDQIIIHEKTGNEIFRYDGCSVVFKKLPQ